MMTDSYLKRLAVLAALAATCACSDLDNCPDGAAEPIRIPYDPGMTNVDQLSFESAPDSGPLPHFPAKSELMFEHGLGVTPLIKKVYLSFTKDGTANADDGSITEVAGNLAPIECADHKVIVVKNDTCERSFYIKVVALGASPHDTGEDECGE